jgi:hypothetical protein
MHNIPCLSVKEMCAGDGYLGLGGETPCQGAKMSEKHDDGILLMGGHLELLASQGSYYTTISKRKMKCRWLCRRGNHICTREITTGM